MRGAAKVSALALTTLAVVFASLSVGPFRGAGPLEVLGLLLGRPAGASRYVIVYRLMRTAAAALLGAGLAASGVSLQYTIRNPLVDPYLAGVAPGALLGVTAGLLLGKSSPLVLYGLAMLGGFATLVLVVGLAAAMGGSPVNIIVVGVTVSYVLSGLTMLLTIMLGPKIPGVLYWMFGSVAFVTWPLLLKTSAIALPCIAGIALMSRSINTFLLGDEVAESLGVRVRAVRLATFVLASSATSALVAMSGPVGFVGLVSPWVARRLVGSRFPASLAASVVIGAELTMVADVVARVIIYPSEAPLTAVTSIFGAPVLAYMLVATRGESRW